VTTRSIVCALCLALAASQALAQGKSQQNKNKNNAPAPPSRNDLAAAPAAVSAPSGTTPLAWVDDASLLAPGGVAVSMSALRWSGGGASELDAPIVDVAAGLAPRLQLSASVPRVVGSSDPDGAVGGVGTSFFAAKIALYERTGGSLKIAASPALQLLGEGVLASLGPGEGRLRWGLPVSAEIARGPARVYGGGGYFSPGLWFTGAAVAMQASEKTFVSVGLSRAWRRSDLPDVPLSDRDRKEISGGAAYVLMPGVTIFGSVGHTVWTLAENGAGTSIAGGASFTFTAAAPKP
jgi:hypothetical protein